MMFLEFFIWGAWLPLIFGYLPSLGFSAIEQGWIVNAFAIGLVRRDVLQHAVRRPEVRGREVPSRSAT